MKTTTEGILDKLKSLGHKFTGKRKEIVDFFVAHQDHYFSAKDVYEYLQQIYPNVSYDTVYRTLALLGQCNVIEHMEFSDDAAKYRLLCDASHHHHLICLGCGRTCVMDTCPMDVIKSIENFHVVGHRFEVYGYCLDCGVPAS